MLKNTLLYHRLWYVKKRKRSSIRIYFNIILIMSILILSVTYMGKNILSCASINSELKTRTFLNDAVNSILEENSKIGVNYEELLIINRDSYDKITSVSTNVIGMNKLSTDIASKLQEKLDEQEIQKIKVPLGALLGGTLFSGFGPDINFKVIPFSGVESNIKSEFFQAGTNQTRYRAYIEIKTTVGLSFPFVKRKSIILNEIPLTDTIIMGNVPVTYLNSKSKK